MKTGPITGKDSPVAYLRRLFAPGVLYTIKSMDNNFHEDTFRTAMDAVDTLISDVLKAVPVTANRPGPYANAQDWTVQTLTWMFFHLTALREDMLTYVESIPRFKGYCATITEKLGRLTEIIDVIEEYGLHEAFDESGKVRI